MLGKVEKMTESVILKPLIGMGDISMSEIHKLNNEEHWISPKTGSIVVEENLREKILFMIELCKYGFVGKTGELSAPSRKFLREIDIIVQTIVIDIQFIENKVTWDENILSLMYDEPTNFIVNCWIYYWNYYSCSKLSKYFMKCICDTNSLFDYVNDSSKYSIEAEKVNKTDDYNINWKCVQCGAEMGETNPRQFCGKTYCLNSFMC